MCIHHLAQTVAFFEHSAPCVSTVFLRGVSTAAHTLLEHACSFAQWPDVPLSRYIFFHFPNILSIKSGSAEIGKNKTVLLSAPWKGSLCLPLVFPYPSLFSVSSLSLTQLRVLGGNPASYPEAHPLPHSLGLPSQPGRLHATEASWPSPPAPAESQRHVMPSGCPPARFPLLPRGPR